MNQFDYNEIMNKELKKYLDRTEKYISAKSPLRDLSEKEQQYKKTLSTLHHANKVLIAEISLVTEMLQEIDAKGFYPIVRNMFRIMCSLKKQRLLLGRIILAFIRIKPEEKEKQAIVHAVKGIKERMERINEVVLKENILYTPLYDYLKISGGTDLMKEINSFMSDDDGTADNELLKKAVEHIVTTVEAAGMNNLCVERRQAYYAHLDDIKKKKEEEKKEQKMQQKEEAKECLLTFCSRFTRKTAYMETDPDIGFSGTTYMSRVNRYGRNAVIVMCAYFANNGRLCYRYLNGSGQPEKRYCHAKHFEAKDVEEAKSCMNNFLRSHPYGAATLQRIG